MRAKFTPLICLGLLLTRFACGQEAASALASTPTPSPTPVPDLLIPAQSAMPGETPPPDIPKLDSMPALSQLDAAFHKSSLGKEADENRLRLEARDLKNRVIREPELVAARKAADTAVTDADKRELLRAYYSRLYSRMRSLAASDDVRKFIDTEEQAHISSTAQPRVRPIAGLSATPKPKHHKKKAKSQ